MAPTLADVRPLQPQEPVDYPRRPGAVVIGLDCSTGLQTARILAHRGVHVTGIAADARHPSCRTNSCARIIHAPTSGPRLVEALERLAPSAPGALLFPCTDAAVLTIAQERGLLEAHFRMAVPPLDALSALVLKDSFAAHAAEHGLPVPRTIAVSSLDEAADVVDRLPPPFVVKPALKTAEWLAAGPKARLVRTAAQWTREAPAFLEQARTLVVQEWVAGTDAALYSCNCYVSPRGVPILTFVAKKLRQWPPLLGTSSLGESVRDDAIRDLALRALSTVQLQGLGYVEIKRDTSGQDVIIEINLGRPTGRSAIAEAGGVELLYTMYCDLAGLPLPLDRVQGNERVKWIHVGRDLRSALWYWRAGELAGAEWLRSLRGRKVYADVDLRDPLPLLAAIARGLRRGIERRGRDDPCRGMG